MITIIRKRTNQIILHIFNSNKPVTIRELSEVFQVSERTIRYDLDEIDNYLMENGFSELIRKPNSGIEIDDSIDENTIKSIINNEKSYEYVLSSKERLKIILLELLQRKDFIVINDLAEMLCVSRSTVVTDLKAVKKTIEDNNLILLSTPNYGLKIKGEEEKIRALTTQLLAKEVDINNAFNSDESIFNLNITRILGDIDFKYIKKCVATAEESLNLVFSDETFYNIIIYIAIVIRRIILNRNISMPQEELEHIQYTAQFSAASYIAKMIEDYFNIEIPIDEIGYITLQFLGGSSTSKEETDNNNYMELEVLVNEIIGNMSRMLNIDLNKDESLFDRLIKHLRPAVFRLRNRLPLKNPLIEQIRCEYGEMFKMVKECLMPLEEYASGKLSDDEVGYFTMLFAVALDKVKSSELIESCKNVLIICSTGNSTSELLASKIDAEFDVNIVGKIALHKVEDYIEGKKIDLIISTVPITMTGIDCIIVNPLLKEKDRQLLKGYLKEKRKINYKEAPITGKQQDERLIECIVNKISKYCTITDHEGLVKEIRDNYIITKNTVHEKKPQYSLTDLLMEDTISLDLIATDWEEAVRKAGELLEKNGYTDSTYTEAMIKEIKTIGPYVVIGEGIALPHSRIQSGAKSVGMSFIRLKNPVKFGNKDKDPVDLVFAMCTTDKNSHRFALTQLARLLDDENMLDVLRNEKSKTVLQKKIKMFLDAEEELV